MIGPISKTADGALGTTDPLFAAPLSFTGDGSYPTGGTLFEPAVRALFKDQRKIIAVIGIETGGYRVAYDEATGKLKVYQTGAINTPAVEVPNTTDLSALTFKVLVLAR